MLRTVFWFMYFVGYLLISLIFLGKYYFLKKFHPSSATKYLHKTTSRWARRMIKMTGARVVVTGLENIPKDETLLFVSNHQGNFDIPLLLGYLPKSVGFVAKVELEKFPIVSLWMKELKCVFMDRKNPRQSIEAILKGIEHLKAGRSMVIFPEGTRSKGGGIGEFKAGSMKLALRSGVRVIPLKIEGSYRILEEKKRIQKSLVHLTIFPPIDINALTSDEVKGLHLKVREIIMGTK